MPRKIRSTKSTDTTSAGNDTGASPVVRVAAYCRYSGGPGQDETSIEAQHNAILREAHHRGDWQITWYDEPDRSAFVEDTSRRLRFRELIADAQAGRCDIVVVDKLDRWSRRQKVTLETWDQLHRAGVGFYSVKERLDFTTPAGWLSANMLASLAEFYARNLSQEVLKGKEVRAQAGQFSTHVPYGYVKAGKGKESVAIADSDDGGTWHGLQMLIESILSGMTAAETAAALNSAGYRIRRYRNREPMPFIARTVSEIRANVFYRPYAPGDARGTIMWRGEEYRGAHQAACTWDQWQTMQTGARGRRRGWAKTARLADIAYTAEFRGLVACAGCGSRLRVHRSATPPAGAYERYLCECSSTQRDRAEKCAYEGRWARVEDVRALWVAWLGEHLRLPQDWQRVIRDGVLSGAGQESQRPDDLAAARDRRRWERKREAARTLYLEGEIDRLEWDRRRRECDAELARLSAVARAPEQQIARLLDAGRIAESLADYWPVWTTPERQRAAAILLEPCGLIVRPLGYRGWYNYWRTAPDEHPPLSCELVDVRLAEPFASLLTTLATSDTAAG